MSAPTRRVRVVAGGKESVANIARFASAPDPDLARPGIEVTMGRDKKAIVRRVRRNAAEPTLPWLLNAPHPVRPSETLTYVGTLEESQRNKYVLLVPEDGAFRMIPCEEWYSFVPRPAPIAAMKRADHERSQADAERRMRARYDGSDSYLERKAGMEKVGRSADEDADFDDVNELRITGEGGGDSDESSEGRMASGRDRDADTDADEQGPKSMDDDVYEGGGEEAAAWMNAGLEKGLGEETDKGEELDMDDKVSDDEGDDGRLGDEEAEPEEEYDDDDDRDPLEGTSAELVEGLGANAQGALASYRYRFQRIDEQHEEEGEEAPDEDEVDDGAAGAARADGGPAAAEGGASGSAAGKRDRPESALPFQAASSAALAAAKRPRVSQGFLQEGDIVQMLRSWSQPPTMEGFMNKLFSDLRSDPSVGTDAFRDSVFSALRKVAMQVMYNERAVLVLRDEYK